MLSINDFNSHYHNNNAVFGYSSFITKWSQHSDLPNSASTKGNKGAILLPVKIPPAKGIFYRRGWVNEVKNWRRKKLLAKCLFNEFRYHRQSSAYSCQQDFFVVSCHLCRDEPEVHGVLLNYFRPKKTRQYPVNETSQVKKLNMSLDHFLARSLQKRSMQYSRFMLIYSALLGKRTSLVL